MKTNSILQLTKGSFKNFLSNIKVFLILLSIFGFIKVGNAQDCSALHDAPACNITGPLVACLNNGLMTDTITIDFSARNDSLVLTLPTNTSGADIVDTNFISYSDSQYIEVVTIDPGTQSGQINLQLNVYVRYPDGCLMSCECSKSITIVNITATASYPPFCTGGTTTLTVVGVGASSYNYTLRPSGPTNSTGIFPGLGAGTYTVAIAGEKQGLFCDDSITTTITASTAPPLTVNNNGPITCTTKSVTLSANGCTPISGVNYSWTGPNNFSSTLQCPTVTVAGTYTVTASMSTGCSVSLTTLVGSNTTLPTLTCSNTGPLPCTEASSVTLQANGCTTTSGVTYSWSGPGFSSASQCPNVSATGTYIVTATNTSNGCTITCTTVVSKNNPPSLSCSNNGPMNCSQLSVTLTANGCTGTGVTYSWTGPYGFASTTQCPTASNQGAYTVVATSTPGCSSSCTTTVDSSCSNLWGCTLGFWKNHVDIWNTPSDAISSCVASAIASFGSGYSGNGTDNSSFAGTFGLTSAQMTAVGYSPSMTLLQALNLGGGQFKDFGRQCVAALLNGCGLSGHYTYSSAEVITIVHNAVISKNYNPITPSFDDDNQNPPDNCPAGGPASKRLMNDGIAMNENVTISAYPNPFTDITTIEISPNINYDNATVELYNVSGQKVNTLYVGAVTAGQTYRFQVNGSDLAQGVYFYSFKAGDDNIFGKVILIK